MEDYGDQILVLLRRIIHEVSIHSKRISSEHRLTLPQLLILREVERADEISVGELANRASLSAATVSSIIDRLKEKQLVDRRRPEFDRRKVYVFLTERGNKVLGNAPSLLQKEFVDEINAMNKKEKEKLYSALSKIASMMGA